MQKNYNARLLEAKLRAKQIAEKTSKQSKVGQSGNVQSSFGRNNKEYLANHGFYLKDSDRKPTKDSVSEKRLKKDIIEIDVRKKIWYTVIVKLTM